MSNFFPALVLMNHMSLQHFYLSAISQLLMTRFWPNLLDEIFLGLNFSGQIFFLVKAYFFCTKFCTWSKHNFENTFEIRSISIVSKPICMNNQPTNVQEEQNILAHKILGRKKTLFSKEIGGTEKFWQKIFCIKENFLTSFDPE